MSHDNNDPLRGLEREAAPPPHLKRRIAKSLRDAGLLRASTWPTWRPIVQATAAVLLLATGFATGRHSVTSPADTRPSYMLLLYEGPDFRRDRPEAAAIAEYDAWAAGLRARGVVVHGEALANTAHLLRETTQGVRVDPEDAASAQGVIAGFFIIRVSDEAEAVAIARTCPHLRHGGQIALRPVIPTS